MDLNQKISCWSLLLPEILDLVVRRLVLRDCITFGKICRSWRSVFVERRSLSRPPPCMAEFESTWMRDWTGKSELLPLWFLHGGQVLELRSPKVEIVSEMLIGSSMGWLVVAASARERMHLLNPTTNERIPLPSLHPSVDISNFYASFFVLSTAPTSEDCRIVAIGSRKLVWCRPGDRVWTVFPLEVRANVAKFHRDELYVLNVPEVLAYSFDPNPRMRRLGLIHTNMNFDEVLAYSFDPNPRMRRLGLIHTNMNFDSSRWQLVECKKNLLLVLCQPKSKRWASSERVHVFKLKDGEWKSLKSLGNQVLLISKYDTLSFSTRDLLGSSFVSDCVYFRMNENKYMERFSMADETIKKIYLSRQYDDIAWVIAHW